MFSKMDSIFTTRQGNQSSDLMESRILASANGDIFGCFEGFDDEKIFSRSSDDCIGKRGKKFL